MVSPFKKPRLPKAQRELNKKLEELQIQSDITKFERTIAENKKATAQSEKDRLEITGFLKEVERKLMLINEWNSNHENIEKVRQESFEKMVQDLKDKHNRVDQLIEALLGFIELGRVSQYRDLNERISNDNLAILELVIQEIKKERNESNADN